MLRNKQNVHPSSQNANFPYIQKAQDKSLTKIRTLKIAFKNCKRKLWEQKATIYVSSTLPTLGFRVTSLYPVHNTLHWERPLDYYITDSSNQKSYKTPEQINQGIWNLLLTISMKTHSGRCWIPTSLQFCFHSSLYNKTNQGDFTPPKGKRYS